MEYSKKELKMSRSLMKILASLNLIAYLGTVTANALANALPINGRNTGEISDSLPNLFVPAGLTFSIWGVIYVLLGMWAVWQFIAVFSGNEIWMKTTDRISWLFVISSIANIGWILAWHYGRYFTSLLLMFVILTSLILIYLRLDIGSEANQMPASQYWAVRVPFSVYLGWITVATVANITALLVHIDWTGFGIQENVWAIIVIVTAAGITAAVLWTRKDFAYSLVVLWAFLGIFLARTQGSTPDRSVAMATAIAGLCIVLFGLLTLLRLNRSA